MNRSITLCLFLSCGLLLTSCGSPVKPKTQWLGEYECRQGVTDLELTIIENKQNRVIAIFHFVHAPTNVEGSFYLSGQYDPRTKEMKFVPGEWIDRPYGYMTVGMEGKILDHPVRYEGRITTRGCGLFRVNLMK